ncbi:hypothetical protein AAEJ42_12840 [Shewanella algae]|uniref:hypothetical protein n=1 Tax=Shewanella algae TaxID=38313 RepID=UPI001AACFBAF|nr:hypothetical protein [Shewanella algae]MBO2625617.1 hypothetical protein [Shewanella algae]
MSKVINLLARLGADPRLQAPEALDKALAEAGVSAEIATAIKDKDLLQLKAELDLCPDVFCIFFPAEDEPEKDEQEDDEENQASQLQAVAS